MSASNVMTPAEAFLPGEFIREELEERGWSEAELAQILGRPVQAVSEILNGKKEITAETAVALGEALGTSAELWLNLQAAYRLHLARAQKDGTTAVARRAYLRSLVPVRELQKRNWLPTTEDLDVLERAVCDLLGLSSLQDEPTFTAAARRSNPAARFTPEQVAWISRIRNLGTGSATAQFASASLADLAPTLVHRVHDPYDLPKLPGWLAEHGLALVIEPALKNSKIDGVVLFTGQSPIVGLSTRGDRLDGFIFTLLHELAHLTLGHVKAGDDIHLDEDITGTDGTDIEAAANELAASWILPKQLDVPPGPLRMPAIMAVARQHGVHPCFVIGRLQREGRLGWGDLRRHIPKVRPFIHSASGRPA